MDNKTMNDPFYQEFKGTPQNTRLKPLHKSSGEKDNLTKLIGEVSSSLRILEDRYSNLRKKTQLTDQTLIETQKKFFNEKRLLGDELVEIKMKLADIEEEINAMRNELKNAVKQKDFKVLEKYLDMWDPMQFVTRKEAEEIIEDTLGKK